MILTVSISVRKKHYYQASFHPQNIFPEMPLMGQKA